MNIEGYEEMIKVYDADFLKHKMRTPDWKKRTDLPTPVRFNFFDRYIKENDKVLDCGCYDGYMLHQLSTFKYIRISGVDISLKAIEKAKENLVGIEHVDLEHCPIEEMPYKDNFFDVVICSQTLEHLKEPIVALKEMMRVLKDDGKLIVSIPNRKDIMDNLHLHYFGFYDIMDLFDKIDDDYKIFKYWKMYPKGNKNISIIVVNKGKKRGDDDNE